MHHYKYLSVLQKVWKEYGKVISLKCTSYNPVCQPLHISLIEY